MCECFGVTDLEIQRAVKENHLKTIEDVTDYVKAGGGCESCHDKIQEIIESAVGTTVTEETRPSGMTNIQKIRLIEETLEREINPELKKDGGGIEFIDFADNTVFVTLRGTCSTCSASQVTLKHYVETRIKDLVSPELVVEEVKQ